MSLIDNEFIIYSVASYPLLWIDTCEYSRAIDTYINDLVQLRKQGKASYDIYKWNLVDGFFRYNYTKEIFTSYEPDNDENKDPLAPILLLESKCKELANVKNNSEYTSVMVFVENYHLFIKNPDIYQKLLNSISILSNNMATMTIVSPIIDIPIELKRYISILDFNLPDKQTLTESLHKIVKTDKAIIDEKDKDDIISSGSGLTLLEFENALFKSFVSNKGKIIPNSIHEQKRQLIRQNGAMDIVKSEYGFERIIGLDNLKYFVPRMVGKRDSRGIMLIGVPGAGKSAFAKAVGKETGRMTISLDIGNLQGSLVGQTEQQTKEALQVIDALQPAILFLDELEKSLSATSNNTYSGDSGVGKRQGGQILRWLNDHKSDIYTIATCNNINNLPPEYLRAGRWDAIFFVGLPVKEEREELLKLYKEIYNIKDNSVNSEMLQGWTGAEIESLCKLAHNMEVSLLKASNYICPMIKVSENEINNMITRLQGIAVPASKYVEKENLLNQNRKATIL